MLFRNHCWQILNQYIRVYMPSADCTLLSSRGGTSARHLGKIPKNPVFFLGAFLKLDSIVKMSTKSMVNGDCDPLDKNKITSTANITGDLCNCIQFVCLLSLQPGPAANIQIFKYLFCCYNLASKGNPPAFLISNLSGIPSFVLSSFLSIIGKPCPLVCSLQKLPSSNALLH